MTEKELNALFYIRKDIKRLNRKLAELDAEDCMNGISYNGMPHGSGNSSPIDELIARREELRAMILQLKTKETLKEMQITSYIETVENEEIKAIMKLRFIDCRKWEEIGTELNMERTTVPKKLRRFLKSQ